MSATMEISAAQVKALRERTSAPMMECKRALTEAGGDMEKAEMVLLKRGIAAAAKKATRTAAEGSIGSYIHAGGKLGVLVDVACESDFVARTAEFQELVHDLAMHIAAAGPVYLTREEVPAEALAAERAKMREQAVTVNPGKPEAILDKIVEGKMAKYYEEHCLAEQHFIKDDKLTVAELVAAKVAKLGEKIEVRRFSRFKIGDETSA